MINWEVVERKQSLRIRGTVLEFLWRTEEKSDTLSPESRLRLHQRGWLLF